MNPIEKFTDPFDTPPPEAPKKAAALIPLAESLDQLNIEDELLSQYQKTQQMLADAEYDETTPLNQKAQTVNAIVGILSTIIKNRESVRNMAEIAILEEALGNTLKEFPAIKEAFLATYEGKLLANFRSGTT